LPCGTHSKNCIRLNGKRDAHSYRIIPVIWLCSYHELSFSAKRNSDMRSFVFLAVIALLAFMTGCAVEDSDQTAFEPGTQKQYVVYDFWAEWCGPCKAFAPKFERMEAKYTRSNITFKRVNVDEDTATAEKYNIHSIPTVVVTADGKEIGRVRGGISEAQLKKFLK
jgi:thioredoxin 1